MPKSSAERSKVYRVKRRLEPGVKKEKRPPKTSAERAREYRARKKALKDAMNRFDIALSVESDFGLPTSKCASLIPGANENWNNEYSYEQHSLHLRDTTPTIPTTSIPEEIQRQYETNIGSKQSPSPTSTPPPTHPQYDSAEDSQTMSMKNYPCTQDDHEIFGAFIASELRGLGNNFSLIRSVKKKIQLTILEAYETYGKHHRRKITPQKDEMTLHQPQPPPPSLPRPRDEPIVKLEYTDDDEQHANRIDPKYQEVKII